MIHTNRLLGFMVVVLSSVSLLQCEMSIEEQAKRNAIIDSIHELQDSDIQKYDENKFYARMNMYINIWNNQKQIIVVLAFSIALLGALISVLQKWNNLKLVTSICVTLGLGISVLTLYSEYFLSDVSREDLTRYIDEAMTIKKKIKGAINPRGNLGEDGIRENYEVMVSVEIRKRVDDLIGESFVDPFAHNSGFRDYNSVFVKSLYASDPPKIGTYVSQSDSSLRKVRELIDNKGRQLLFSTMDTIYSQELRSLLHAINVNTDSVGIYKPSIKSDFIYPENVKSRKGSFSVENETINYDEGQYKYEAEIFLDTTYTRRYIQDYLRKYQNAPIEKIMMKQDVRNKANYSP
ncbi:hypothetical protein HQ531_06065 [bacterium]|nr:hypothetical protein [bacterium]